jgi:hypothetical protein
MKGSFRVVSGVFLFATCSLCIASNTSRSSSRHASSSQESAAFMLVSGITAQQEFCLSVESGNIGVDGAGVVLERCAEAVAAGDGREIFSLQVGGQMANVAGGKCVGLHDGDVADGGQIVLVDCDTASQWEALGNGQLKLKDAGDLCLSQQGLGPGRTDVAANAAVLASSTANVISHGAAMAVDASAATFWASKFDDVKEPVDFVIDVGEVQRLHSVELSWEFPARAFSVSLSKDGEHFSEAFATDANVLKTTRINLGSAPARKLRITMSEPHPTHARFQGHFLYGIRSVAVHADRLRAVVAECAKASKSSDARDKYFMSYVGEFDPFPAKALRNELPSLDAAAVSLGAAASELADAIPLLDFCGVGTKPAGGLGAAVLNTSVVEFRRHDGVSLASQSGQASQSSALSSGPGAESVDAQNGLDIDALDLLLSETRASILGVRKVFA